MKQILQQDTDENQIPRDELLEMLRKGGVAGHFADRKKHIHQNRTQSIFVCCFSIVASIVFFFSVPSIRMKRRKSVPHHRRVQKPSSPTVEIILTGMKGEGEIYIYIYVHVGNKNGESKEFQWQAKHDPFGFSLGLFLFHLVSPIQNFSPSYMYSIFSIQEEIQSRPVRSGLQSIDVQSTHTHTHTPVK